MARQIYHSWLSARLASSGIWPVSHDDKLSQDLDDSYCMVELSETSYHRQLCRRLVVGYWRISLFQQGKIWIFTIMLGFLQHPLGSLQSFLLDHLTAGTSDLTSHVKISNSLQTSRTQRNYTIVRFHRLQYAVSRKD